MARNVFPRLRPRRPGASLRHRVPLRIGGLQLRLRHCAAGLSDFTAIPAHTVQWVAAIENNVGNVQRIIG